MQLPEATSKAERVRYNKLDFVQLIGKVVLSLDKLQSKDEIVDSWFDLVNPEFRHFNNEQGDEIPQPRLRLQYTYTSYSPHV